MYKVTNNIELQISNMTLDEAYFWAAKVHSIYHTSEKPLVDAAVLIVNRHEEKIKAMIDKEVLPALEEAEEKLWDALPWYKKIIPFILGLFDLVVYGATELVFWKIRRWHIAVFFVVLAVAFFGGRGVMGTLKNWTIANADPPAPEVMDPEALLGEAPQADSSGAVPDPSAFLQPLPTQGTIVDCTMATCLDATPYRVDYQGSVGPKGSGTLRAQCLPKDSKEKSPVLGEVLQNTIVWVKTATIQPGKFEENGENRVGFIYPTSGFPNGGCISFTALHPVNP